MSLFTKIGLAWDRRQSIGHIIESSRATFSQYGEDLVFDQLLHPLNQGTFVDVGANHPIAGSNTYKLYSKGWRGLAIDPNPKFASLFRARRPRDIYVAEGCAKEPSCLTYYEFANDVFNTFDRHTAEKLRAHGNIPTREQQVRCRPLSEIVEQHMPDVQIDFLNIDCEGFDLEVLASLDLSRRRPTTIVVEDYPRFLTFRDSVRPEALERFLRSNSYVPIAQLGWSGIYIAEDWRELFTKSSAFSEQRVQNGYLPAQATLESVGVTDYKFI